MKALILNCSPVKNGATDLIVQIAADVMREKYDVQTVCIDDYSFSFCRGCRACHTTGRCVLNDDVGKLMADLEQADVIVCVSLSYWADVPGQFKAFIDRCTPWSNTHEPHASLSFGKRGYAIALRTGPGMKECEHIIETIEHFYGHLEIERCGHIGFVSIESRADVGSIKEQLIEFCQAV